MALIGQFVTSSELYIKHPVASSGWLANGYPLDAGTVMTFAHNQSVLAKEKTRVLVSTFSGFRAVTGASCNNYYEGLTDCTSSNPTTETTNRQISWDQRCSVFFGPFFLPLCAETSTGQKVPNPIKVNYAYRNLAVSPAFDMYFALTTTELPPSEGYIDIKKVSSSTIGTFAGSVALSSSSDMQNYQTLPGRNGENSLARSVFLWVGLNNNVSGSGGYSDFVNISAYEVLS